MNNSRQLVIRDLYKNKHVPENSSSTLNNINSKLKKSMKKHNLLLFVLILVITSCSAPKNIAYFQDAEAIRGMMLQAEQQLRLRPQDKINIIVNSSDPMLEQQFTLTASSSANVLGSPTQLRTTASRNTSMGMIIAYTVDQQGDINFPVLGKIPVAGQTRTEVADYITKRLIARDLVKDPIVTVEFVNLGVNVLGEVKNPGHQDITKDHYTILDAIAHAGDLTINGQRENVMVCRHEDGADNTYIIDLTNRQQMLLSPGYYLQQDDVVVVTPNDKAKRGSTLNGNTVLTPSFWISVASLLATITALILR